MASPAFNIPILIKDNQDEDAARLFFSVKYFFANTFPALRIILIEKLNLPGVEI
jgi:hypothetical protein